MPIILSGAGGELHLLDVAEVIPEEASPELRRHALPGSPLGRQTLSVIKTHRKIEPEASSK